MRSSLVFLKPRIKLFGLVLILLTLLSLSQACSKKSPTLTSTKAPILPTPTPTSTPQPLPPALVETDPLPGAQLALKNPIRLYFNQPMDQPSVEGALSGSPALSGSFTWQDDSSLVFTPDSPLLPGTSQTISIAASAKSARGMAMLKPVSLSFTTGDYLRLSQHLPDGNASDVNPTGAIVAAFNQPVVALGADPSSLPAAFTISPTAEGAGEWINTSTYIFYPQPALSGGATYHVSINPDLVSTAGAPLETAPEWTFQTVLPRLVSTTPNDYAYNVHLDTGVTLNFSYSMDTTSVENNFSLQNQAGDTIDGETAWNDNFTSFTFTPTVLLERNTPYLVRLNAEAAALGGTPLGEPVQVTWYTVPKLAITGSNPSEGGIKPTYQSLGLFVSSYISTENIEDYVTFEPAIPRFDTWMDNDQLTLNFWGSFEPDTDYTLTISPDLSDLWGSQLGEPYTLHFRSGPLDPAILFPYTSDATFLTTSDTGLLAQVTNLSEIPISMGTLAIDDLVQMYGIDGYQFRQNFIPRDSESWTFRPEVPPNRSTTVNIPIAPDGGTRAPGLYFMRFNVPSNYTYTPTSILAISKYQATLKITSSEAFVWAMDLETNTPAADLPVSVYDQSGRLLVSGTTDSSGVFQGAITAQQDPYGLSFAILGTEGEDDFGFVFSSWSDGANAWDFNISANYYPSTTIVYIYSDRPIYRPGDTVHFRLVVRQVSNGRYSLPDMDAYTLQLNDPLGTLVATFDLPLSGFGTANGEYNLPSNAVPGTYSLANMEMNNGVWFGFQVADYRKPDINLEVTFRSTDVLSGTALLADVNARYFFDAPAGNMPVHWVLYRQNSSIDIPNYQVGPTDTSWLDVYTYGSVLNNFGRMVTEGYGTTDKDGLFIVETTPEAQPGRQKYTLEVTLTDESGLPVSARNNMYVNPAEYYIGVHPDAWSYAAKAEAGFDVLTVDWNGDPSGGHALEAKFQSVVWVRQDPDPDKIGFDYPTYTPEYTFIEGKTITTDADGKARLGFVPPEPGTYQVDVSADGTLTQVVIWVAGEGRATWPSLPNQRLRLVTGQDTYQPGDTAEVFIPNPFSTIAHGLLTVERGKVMRYQLLELEPGGSTIQLALSQEDAPNVYVSVTLLGNDEDGNPDFRLGYTTLTVDPSFEYLDIELTSQPERAGPGDPVKFSLRVTDKEGTPIEGEFSLSVVDLAALALADPNAKGILSAFYGEQQLNVRTGNSMAAYGQRLRYMPGGMGGGGGESATSVTRENFPDTAYWDAQIVTDANGEASVSINLPDTLTTWQVLVRGLTADTKVGETQLEVVTTKELLVRPVTPRFLVVGDRAMLAAVAQNNTASELQGSVTLQASGFVLDDAKSAAQQVTIPPYGRVRVEWWGTAEDAPNASLRFSVQAGSLQDAVLVSRGALPILHYTSPQTFSTSGALAEGGEQLELVSLPRSFDATSGSLDIEMDPSLAAAMMDSLEALEDYPYDCTEPIVSSFLPNLVTYTTLKDFAIDSPDLQSRLDRTLKQGLEHLLSLQKPEGGWGWCQNDGTDANITSYALYSLVIARNAGMTVPGDAIDKAIGYLSSQLFTPTRASGDSDLDRLAFQSYALMLAQYADSSTPEQLYSVRDQLSPWAQAMLALTLENYDQGNDNTQVLLSDLQATAIRSATGLHWEAGHRDWSNMTSTLSNSALVLYALAKLEPASTLIPDAVNFLMSNRLATGCWSSSYENAWIILAMNEVMKGTGELNSNYGFSSSLNGTEVASGEAAGATQLNPVVTSIPISQLYPNDPNAVTIQRDPGTGRLYYTAALKIYTPVEDAAALDRGISVSRDYFTQGADLKTASPVEATRVGEMLTVRLTAVLPNDTYHFVIEDYIPAGTEILNTSLKTSQQGIEGEAAPLYDPIDPYGSGWGWWLFGPARIFDDHISWTAAYLPAGTYQLTYTLVILQAGEYRVLPARAWMLYFPEVQGTSEGRVLEIKP